MAKKKKSDEARLELIIDLCDLIAKDLENVSQVEFENSRLLQDATAYRLAAIGEECNYLSDDVTVAHDLPWPQIIGMRNRLVHDYIGNAPEVIWQSAKTDTTPLQTACEKSLKDLTGK